MNTESLTRAELEGQRNELYYALESLYDGIKRASGNVTSIISGEEMDKAENALSRCKSATAIGA